MVAAWWTPILVHPLALNQLAPSECMKLASASLDSIDNTTLDLIPVSWFRGIHTSSTISVETVSSDLESNDTGFDAISDGTLETLPSLRYS